MGFIFIHCSNILQARKFSWARSALKHLGSSGSELSLPLHFGMLPCHMITGVIFSQVYVLIQRKNSAQSRKFSMCLN